MKKVIVIGGMAGGCKTAVRLKRLRPDYQVTIIEKRGFLSYGTCGMPFYASGDVDEFFDLAKTPYGVIRDDEFFRYTKGVEALTDTEVVSIDLQAKEITCRDLLAGEGDEFTLSYDDLVFATGALPVLPPISIPESSRISTFHHPLDAKRFKDLAEKGKIGKVVIIGAGYVGCELAEAMTAMWGIETYLIEKEPHVLPASLDEEMAQILQNLFEKEGINVILNSRVTKIEGGEEGCEVYLEGGNSIDCDYVFLCTGIKPNVELAQKIGVEIGKCGGIVVNNRFQTNVDNIWAVGDCIEVKNIITNDYDYFAYGSLANKEARILADNLAGIDRVYIGATGANSIKVFGFVLGAVGLSEIKAKKLYNDVASVIGTWYDRPDYHPDTKNIYAKLIYQRTNRRLLGLQVMGYGEVTRYVDAFSAILQKGNATIEDLVQFEHCYTPPHSSPLNPLNNLGFIADNQERFGVECVKGLDGIGSFDVILDVREDVEIEEEPFIQDAKRINLGKLRYRIDELEKDKSVLVFCQKGSRSYEAVNVLKNGGFQKVAFLGGGAQFYSKKIE